MTLPQENPEHAGSLGRQIADICVGLLNAAGVKSRQASKNSIALNQWLSYRLIGLGVPHIIAIGYVKVGADRTVPDEIRRSGPRCAAETNAPLSQQHAWIELRDSEFIDATLLHRLEPASSEAGPTSDEGAWDNAILHRAHSEYLRLGPLEYCRQGTASAMADAAFDPAADGRNLQILLRMQEISQRD